MHNKQISSIAQQVGISKSAVSRALNHCYGISSEMREQVISTAERIGYTPRKNADIFVIIPEVPSYFWGCCFPTAPSEVIQITYHVYSHLVDTAMVCRYLEDAEKTDAKVIILVADKNDAVAQIVSRLSSDRLVIFLNKQWDLKNTFFVGCDSKAEGATMAEICRKYYPDEKILLISSYPSQNEYGYLPSFLQALGENYILLETALNSADTVYSAQLARLLNQHFTAEKFGAIVVFDGITHLLCLAAEKLHLPQSVGCFGLENPPQNQKYWQNGRLKAVLCQSFQQQLEYAVRLGVDYLLTGRYPDRKYHFLPFSVVTGEEIQG